MPDNTYRILLKANRMNMCDFFDHPEKEPYLKMFFENLKDFGYMMSECPVKKVLKICVTL